MDRMVTAGRVGRLFGTKGELMITLYDVFSRDFNIEEPVFVKIDSLTVPLFFNKFERRGQKGAVVSFDDIDTDERALELIGMEFAIRESAEVAKNVDATESADVTESAEGLCMEDLIGWDVEFDTGERGRITDFIYNEFNPLFEVEIGSVSELIPASNDFIVELDETRRKVIFALPEGLLRLND